MKMKRIPQHLTAAVLALVLLGGAAGARAGADDAVLAAQAAFRNGDAARLDRHAAQLEGHVLAPWVAYWRLKLRLEEAAPADIHAFLSRHAGSYQAERLRADWLKVLGKRGDWTRFNQEIAPLVLEERDTRCYTLAARLVGEDRGALEEALRLWLEPRPLGEGCEAMAEQLSALGALPPELAWARARTMIAERRVGDAQRALRALPKAQRPEESQVALAGRQPESVIANYLKHPRGASAREVALLAMLRLAAADPVSAAALLEGRMARAFAEADRAPVWARIGMEAARRHSDEALAWYARAGRHALGEEEAAWKVRAALRAGDWAAVRNAIDDLAPEMRRESAWVYWYGRALAALGNDEGARAHWRRVAGLPEFYGLLATEALGEVPVLPAQAPRASDAQVAEAGRVPGLARALELYRLGLRSEAVREWLFTVRGFDDARLLAAAELARRAEVFDRAINTADRTQASHDFSLRYLAPFREVFAEYARAQELDPAWVLGLVRQESRFIVDARSSAGARGLMQLMPRTASWMAGKIGLRDFHPQRVAHVETNVTLGTGYLKLVLEDLGHPVLATAGYNAGPGRARRWRAPQPLEGAVYAETIPFDETRDYVKKVMSNTVFYALLEGRRVSLTERMGRIPARVAGERGRDLP